MNTFWCNHNMHIFHELRSLCLSYFGFLVSEAILSEYKQKQFTQYLVNHFNAKHNCNIQNFRLRLLYRATGLSYDANVMRLFCNKNTKHLFILLKNKQRSVFGGYTSFGRIEVTVPFLYHINDSLRTIVEREPRTAAHPLWSDPFLIRPIHDSKAFLFRYLKNGAFDPEIFPLIDESRAIFPTLKSRGDVQLFLFGDSDLWITCKGNKLRCKMTPNTYQFLDFLRLDEPCEMIEIHQVDCGTNIHFSQQYDSNIYDNAGIKFYIQKYWYIIFPLLVLSVVCSGCLLAHDQLYN
eukprot:244577_1